MSLKNSDSEMGRRMESSWQRAVSAMSDTASGKKVKHDPLLENSLNNKAFNGVQQGKYDKSANSGQFRYNQKSTPGTYKMTRSFFGIKNPWLGAKVYDARKADVETKTMVDDINRKFTDKQAKTSEFYQAGKSASKQEKLLMKTDAFVVKGETPGVMTQANERVGKEMTIEQVRDLLNKERKSAASGNL
jgi:hypothetical protein